MAAQEGRKRLKESGGRRKPNTGYSIRHTTNMHLAVKEVEQAYAKLLVDVSLTKEMFEAMMKTPVTTAMKNSFFDFIVNPTKDESDKEVSKAGLTRQANKKDELEKYLIRHWIKPGITGWAQVNGFRGETKTKEAMQKRVDLDIWYIENWSFWLDMRIVFMTIYNGLKGEEMAY